MRSAVSPLGVEFRRNRGFDRDVGVGLPPKPHQRCERIGEPKLGKANGPQPFEHAPVGLLQRIHLIGHRVDMLAQGVEIGLGRVGQPRQRSTVGAQCKQIGAKLIVQVARDLLALGVLQRDHPFGEPPLFLDRRLKNGG